MLKKEEIYVSVESKEQEEMFRKVLEAMGEPISGYYEPFVDTHSRLVYYGEKWMVGFGYGKQKINFGELIDLLQRKPRIKTEDGVDCYDGDTIVSVYIKDLCIGNNRFVIDSNDVFTFENYKYFSSESKALDWIEAQKPKTIKVSLYDDLITDCIVEKGKVVFHRKYGGIVSLYTREVEYILKAMEELQNG